MALENSSFFHSNLISYYYYIYTRYICGGKAVKHIAQEGHIMPHFFDEVTSPTLDSDFENIISNFILKWKELEDIFSIGCTLKIHIIGTHLLDVLKETGKTLHDESDEPVEQAHRFWLPGLDVEE